MHHGSSSLEDIALPSSPRSALQTAAAASAIWHTAASNSNSPEPPQRSSSPTSKLGRAAARSRAGTPVTRQSQKSPLRSPTASAKRLVTTADAEEDEAADFQSGVRHAGWLWKRFGHGHKATWKKLWVYLCDDRLCYHQPEPIGAADATDAYAGSPTASSRSKAAAAAAMVSASMDASSSAHADLPLVGHYGHSLTLSTTAASLAALAAGEVRYIALDRIPVRPLPHRQHEFDPCERSHPDVGVTIVDDSVIISKPTQVPPNATFSLVAGSHTHYFAAEGGQRAAELWVTLIRETWLHCFSHTARCTGGGAGVVSLTASASGVMVSQKLLAENALLRESIQELNQQVTQTNGEYWRKWVEEKARSSVLESKLINTATYELVVRTGNAKGSATDARVYVELYGPDAMTPAGALGHMQHTYMLSAAGSTPPPGSPSTAAAVQCASGGAGGGGNSSSSPGGGGVLTATADSSGEVRLFDADSTVKPFQRGATDSFTVACYNVGLPARLKVWHDNTGRHPDWFLVDVRVRKQGVKEWVTFPCNRWLSTQYEDGSISRVLTAGSSRPPVTYKVLVATSDVRGAGTDANVYLQLHGLLGDGLQHQLLGSASAFDRGTIDEFFIDDADLGELTAVTISHDGSGSSPAWHLAHIEVTPWLGSLSNQQTPLGGGSTRCITPSSLSGGGAGAAGSGGGGGAAAAWGVGSASSPNAEGQQQYQMMQRRVSAGSPCSPPYAGMRASLGAVQQQLRRSTSRTNSPAPFSQSRAGVNGGVYLFPCDAWLDETLGGGLTKRRLPVASCLDSKAWYTLYITTTDIRGAGTDADVHIALSGSQGSSGVVALPSQLQQYQRGQRDKFRLQLPPLGHLQKLLIGHNNHGEVPSWHLSLVEVVEEASGQVTYFAADRWLGAQCGDGLSEVTLAASSTDPRQAQCEYQVCFLTSAARGSGTDSTVGFELRGSKGSSGPITVSAGHSAFQRGSSDTFSYRRPHLGQLQQLMVWHDNSGASTPGGRGPWGLDAVVVSCKADQQVVTFPFGGWLSPETKLKVQLAPGQAKGPTRYRFDVVTSDVRGAGTDAAITLALSGPAGTTAAAGPWVLDRQGAFGRNQTDSFTVEGPDVSSPTSLTVTLNTPAQPTASATSSWHLDHIVCTVLEGREGTAGRKYYFVADRWFDSAAGTTRAVLAGSSQLPKQGADLKPYTVRVFTSRLRGAGTDANVAINAIGLLGASGWRELPAHHSTCLQQGQEDTFTVLLPDVGPLTHLGVRSDGSGQHPAWHLEKVCLQPVQQQQHTGSSGSPASPHSHQQQQGLDGGSSAVWFSAQRWLGTAHGLEVLLPAQAGDPSLDLVHYRVDVHTSDVKNAGTDCRVFLQLTGDACAGPPAELLDAASTTQQQQQQAVHGTFQRSCVDTFDLQLPPLGVLRTAAVWLEGRASPWHLDWIVVTGPGGEQTFFVCGGWLGSSACGSSGATSAVTTLPAPLRLATSLSPVELPASSTDPRKAMREYKVVTFTSDMRGAGTDAGVYVELIDNAGASSGRKSLVTSAPDAFERGKRDEFSITDTCQALGSLSKLRLGHDSRGAKPAWHVSKVEVTDVATGKTWYFGADCWLDAAQGDGATERLLAASDRDPWADLTAYKVTVVTSSRPDAGNTGAAVSVTLYGSKGPPVTSTHGGGSSSSTAAAASAASGGMLDSGRCELSKATVGGADGGATAITLEAGSRRSFTLPHMRNLGQLRQLLLEVDASSQQAVSWHCQHVEVSDTRTGETWLFPCNAWLGSSTSTVTSSHCEPCKLLHPAASLDGLYKQLQEEEERQQGDRYKVAVYTSAHSPAQGCVTALMLSITDAGGGTLGPVRLTKAPQPCFGARTCDVFEVSAATKLGALQEARVSCELSSATGSCWHLDTIAVTAQSTGVTTWFFAGCWFDAAAAGCEALLQGSSQDVRQQLTQYKVTTHTSDTEGAGTSSRVCMSLSGSAGSSGSFDLSHPSSITAGSSSHPQPTTTATTSSSSNNNGYGRGDAASFVLSCVGLGELQQLTVWHDSSGAQPSWHLAYVEVTDLGSGKVWYFPCNQWLGSRRGDGATRRILQATTNFSPDSLLMRYRVRAVTGDVRGAATDCGVFVDVRGSLGATGPKRLNPAPDAVSLHISKAASFERSSTREATVSGLDVGDMTHVVVSIDGRGLLSSWFLEQLDVEHMGTGQLLSFKVARWLDDKRPGCSLQYELWPEAAKEQQQQSSAKCKWELVLHTGSVPGAGTDADVSVELHGTSGVFGPHMLPASTDAFQEGCRDSFSLETLDLGELLTLVISHNSKGRRASWYLHGVELTHAPSGTRYSWHVAAWLNPQQGCSKTLRATHAQRGPLQMQPMASSSSKTCSYQLEVQTADVEGAGTSASMFVQLAGALREAEAVQLTSSGGTGVGCDDSTGQESGCLFQRGCLDVFILKGLPDVGPLTHLTIGHDGAGPQPGWCLAWVRVINLTTGARALFAGPHQHTGSTLWLDGRRPGCQNWAKLSAQPDDSEGGEGLRPQQQPGQLSGPQDSPMFGAQLQLTSAAAAGAAAGGSSRPKGWMHNSKHVQPGYSLVFHTSNIWAAGTGSKVFFELLGQHGSSGVVYPTGPQGQFSRGCKASFLFPRLPYVGALHQLRVGTDGRGLFAAWHLRQVEVVHVHTGQRWLFDCNEWLDRHNVWQVLLPAISV